MLAAALVAANTVALAANYGLQAGAKLPAFSLPDQNGTTRTLKDIVGPKGAAIVFFRSADW
jgi:peroxiredoxin